VITKTEERVKKEEKMKKAISILERKFAIFEKRQPDYNSNVIGASPSGTSLEGVSGVTSEHNERNNQHQSMMSGSEVVKMSK